MTTLSLFPNDNNQKSESKNARGLLHTEFVIAAGLLGALAI